MVKAGPWERKLLGPWITAEEQWAVDYKKQYRFRTKVLSVRTAGFNVLGWTFGTDIIYPHPIPRWIPNMYILFLVATYKNRKFTASLGVVFYCFVVIMRKLFRKSNLYYHFLSSPSHVWTDYSVFRSLWDIVRPLLWLLVLRLNNRVSSVSFFQVGSTDL